MEKICVLIPSYNEARTIGHIVNDIKRIGLPVYIVDDGSSDKTGSIAASEGAIALTHEKNMGKGASLREGFERILKDGFQAVLIMDGDGQHETGDIKYFIGKMEKTGADIVIGNRMSDTSSMPRVRKATNRIMSYVVSKICGQSLPDTQCGFRLIKRKVLENIKLESSNFEIDSEILIKAAKKGFKIESVPVKTIYKGEASSINPVVDTIRFIAFLIRLAK